MVRRPRSHVPIEILALKKLSVRWMDGTVLSAGKAMDSVFWDSHGIIYINYLKNSQTGNKNLLCGKIGVNCRQNGRIFAAILVVLS